MDLKMKQKKILKKSVTIILGIILPLLLIGSSLILVSRTSLYYNYGFKINHVLKDNKISGVTEQELGRLMSSYINGNTKEFQIEGKYKGTTKPLFNEKEQKHMAEVKVLVNQSTKWMVGGLALVLIWIIYLIRKKELKQPRSLFKISVGAFFAYIIAAVVTTVFFFDEAFTLFHEVFFNSDLWLLDPNKDVLLMLMPLNFFIFGFALALGIALVLLSLTGFLIYRYTREKNMFF